MNIAMNIEHWALIDGYDNYEVSPHGFVRNNKTSRILSRSVDGEGYYKVVLCKHEKKKHN